ncbi:siderophore ABC transporter substrate-binding protein [Bacillus massiliigorillae]|uniref:siderophore ABC transporter substrate-binding protein n=1 Tax=Bacillus massiliigorillae TaxID=1243664 RepID=UPI0003A67FC9|nr:siderophore ABC transporter substrate-binding protein [Bacillus massiliigorillae]
MKKSLLVFLLALFTVVLAACGSNDTSKEDEKTSGDDKKEEVVTVKHEYGETKVEKNPKKVVVFDFGSLDTMDALGVGDSVVGLPKQNIPSYLSQYDKEEIANAGGLKEPDFEAIKEAEPDLIIISGRQADSYDKFAEIAPTIYQAVDTTDYINSFKKNVETLAEIFGKEDEAKTKLADIDKAIEDTKAKVPADKKGLIVLSNAKQLSAYGAGSRFGLIHDVLGVTPADKDIKESTHGNDVTAEYVLDKNPDYLFVIDRDAAVGEQSTLKETVQNEIVGKTNAAKNDKIISLDPEIWYLAGGGLESVAQMVKEVSEGISK